MDRFGTGPEPARVTQRHRVRTRECAAVKTVPPRTLNQRLPLPGAANQQNPRRSGRRGTKGVDRNLRAWGIPERTSQRLASSSAACGPAHCGPFGQHEGGLDELAPRCCKPTQQGRCHAKRRTRDDLEGPSRQAKIARVGLHDLHREARKTLAKHRCAFVVQLDRDHKGTSTHQCGRDRPSTCSHVDNEISRPHIGQSDQRRGPGAI
jgi:hypothetical protein